jgi:hypothetical protein
MTDALSCFMTDFLSMSPNSAGSFTVTIISDNAKQSPLPFKGRPRRAAPRRSISSPMHQTSRWEEAPSALGSHRLGERKSSPVESSPLKFTNKRISRWESSSPSKSSNSTGLRRPTRKSYSDMDKYGATDTDFMVRNVDIPRLGGNALPHSLRKLPY